LFIAGNAVKSGSRIVIGTLTNGRILTSQQLIFAQEEQVASPKMQELNASIPKPKARYAHDQAVCVLCRKPMRPSGGIRIYHRECVKAFKHG
jgi:hypothetical protein